MKKSTYESAAKNLRIFNRAVKKAQAENHKKGLPNVYSIKGKIYYEYPDGTLKEKS